MSDPAYNAKIYPQGGHNPTITNADPNRADVGVCFSGGGSRALTCAWGQMIGLRNSSVGEVSLMDRVRYISSVSGGSWASALYTYLPASISDEEFFPGFFSPRDLFLNTAPAGAMDVSEMGAHAMGLVPQKFANLFELDPLDNIIAQFIGIVLIKRLDLSESLKWLWMYIVGNDVLAPFGLYAYDFSLFGGGTPWNYDGAKYFGLSPATNPPQPAEGDFQFVRADSQGNVCRPMLVINTNIVGETRPGPDMMGPVQIPVQVTPVSGGSLGSNPVVPQQIVGGGSVESFAFTSLLQSKRNDQEVRADFPRVYSLVDITSVSSGFYAATLAQGVEHAIASMIDMEDDKLTGLLGDLLDEGESLLGFGILARLRSLQKEFGAVELSDLVPQYNDWPVGRASDGQLANKPTQFTDGGDLENTGVLGMLAQTNVSNIIAFVNTDVRLEKTADDVIVAAAQASPLFGIAFDSDTKQFKEYQAGGVNPFTGKVDPKGFLKVFDNSGGEFATLRKKLYRANGSGANTGPAFFRQSLAVAGSPLAGVAARAECVSVLWVQNAQVNDWQTQITDRPLSDAIANGQREGGLSEFAEFPYYDTFRKIHQTEAETNTLAQMWAWCVADTGSPLCAAMKNVFGADAAEVA